MLSQGGKSSLKELRRSFVKRNVAVIMCPYDGTKLNFQMTRNLAFNTKDLA